MPRTRCKNIPEGCKAVYYTGTERTPLGLGISSRYEPVGIEHRGKDGRMYMVGYSGVNTKRWIYMSWL
jgi:hypothetical protein